MFSSRAQSIAVAIPRSPLFSVSLFSLLFLFSSVFRVLYFVLFGEPRAKMFIVYMLPYYIEVFYYVSIGKILKCGVCWCVLLINSYFVVRCVLVTYSGRNTSKTASKPPQIGATSIFFQVVMLHIAYDASILCHNPICHCYLQPMLLRMPAKAIYARRNASL